MTDGNRRPYDWADEPPDNNHLIRLFDPARRRVSNNSDGARPAREARPGAVSSSPREPSADHWVDRRSRGADDRRPPEPPTSTTLGWAPVTLVAISTAAAVGTVRFLEWSSLAGTWWALFIIYTVAIAGGVAIAAVARGGGR